MDREQERLRKREYRRRKREEATDRGVPRRYDNSASGGTGGTVTGEYIVRPKASVVSIAPEPPPPSTEVQDGVRAELVGLAASETHPGLVAASLAMARILDDPKSVPQHPGAARSLDGLLLRLHDLNKGRGGGKLAAMRQARGSA